MAKIVVEMRDVEEDDGLKKEIPLDDIKNISMNNTSCWPPLQDLIRPELCVCQAGKCSQA